MRVLEFSELLLADLEAVHFGEHEKAGVMGKS